MRRNAKNFSPIKLIWVVLTLKIIRFVIPPNQNHSRSHPVPARGAFRDRHERWARDAVDALMPDDERRLKSGRRSRVVLTPRRWRQVRGANNSAGDGGKKARFTEEITKETVKAIRAGNAGRNRRDRGDYARVLFLFSHARLRARIERPAFPAPSLLGARRIRHRPGAIAPREGGGVPSASSFLRTQGRRENRSPPYESLELPRRLW
jgi:hypothetical protein